MSGNLIGFYYKTQPQAKPIYRHSSIVLHRDKSDADDVHSCSVDTNTNTTASASASGVSAPEMHSFINSNLVSICNL